MCNAWASRMLLCAGLQLAGRFGDCGWSLEFLCSRLSMVRCALQQVRDPTPTSRRCTLRRFIFVSTLLFSIVSSGAAAHAQNVPGSSPFQQVTRPVEVPGGPVDVSVGVTPPGASVSANAPGAAVSANAPG